eukprot:s2461_g15.t1
MALWRVLGDNGDKSGESSCGILVRDGQGLQTPVLGRLSFGAVVLALADNSSSSSAAAPSRLRYRLLRGKGPKEGWVSIRCKGKALLAEADRPDLDPEQSTPFPAIGLDKPNLGAASGWASWHGFKRVANFRDVADSNPCSHPIRCRNGKVLRRGMLFRSGHFAAATKEDLAVLQELQLRTYVDLREGRDFEGADAEVHHVLFPPSPSTTERGAPPAVPPGGRRLWCPVTKDLRLRGWTADEKVGAVPESDRKAWTSWWFQRLTRVADAVRYTPLGDTGAEAGITVVSAKPNEEGGGEGGNAADRHLRLLLQHSVMAPIQVWEGVNTATTAPALVPSGPPVPDPASSAEVSSATAIPVAHAAGSAPPLPGPSLSPGSTAAGATIPKAATPVQHYQQIMAKTTPPVRPTAPKARPPAASTANYVMPGWTITITFQPNP